MNEAEAQNVLIFTLNAIVFRLLGVFIILAGITLTTPDGWDIGRIDVLPSQSVPSDLGEPGVVLDIFGATVEVAQTLGQIGGDQL